MSFYGKQGSPTVVELEGELAELRRELETARECGSPPSRIEGLQRSIGYAQAELSEARLGT